MPSAASVPTRRCGSAAFFGNSAEFWLGLQADYDLETTLDTHGDAIRRDVQPMDA